MLLNNLHILSCLSLPWKCDEQVCGCHILSKCVQSYFFLSLSLSYFLFSDISRQLAHSSALPWKCLITDQISFWNPIFDKHALSNTLACKMPKFLLDHILKPNLWFQHWQCHVIFTLLLPAGQKNFLCKLYISKLADGGGCCKYRDNGGFSWLKYELCRKTTCKFCQLLCF